MRGIAAVLFGLCAFGAAHAADLNDPVWDRAPGQDDWAKAYPAHAAQAGISGAVKMKCAATSAGLLANCAVIQESPSGEGFGAAALSLASQMALKPTGDNGQPVAGRNLIVPVKFDADTLRHPGALIMQPEWLRKPSADEVARFFPANAPAHGHARMKCFISSRGLLDGCSVTEETPVGHGFGAAILAMSSIFVMRPMTIDGRPVGGGSIELGVVFQGGSESGPTTKILRVAPWMSTPTLAGMAAAFPREATGKAPNGHVVLRCGIGAAGKLDSCEVVSESPEHYGFALAAKGLAKDFRVASDPAAQKLGDLKIDVPFDFRDPGQSAIPVEIYEPAWLRTMSPGAAAALFPAAAAKAGLKQGRATLACNVAHDGSLQDCGVVSEDPAGLGFGDAALKIAAVTAMNPWTAQGTPVDGAKVRLPIRLVAPDDAAAQPPAAKP